MTITELLKIHPTPWKRFHSNQPGEDNILDAVGNNVHTFLYQGFAEAICELVNDYAEANQFINWNHRKERIELCNDGAYRVRDTGKHFAVPEQVFDRLVTIAEKLEDIEFEYLLPQIEFLAKAQLKVRQEASITIPAGHPDALTITTDGNGGLNVEGGDID